LESGPSSATNLLNSETLFENVSEKEPISADVRYKTGASRLNNNQYAIYQTVTLNTKTTNNKGKIHEFNLKAAKKNKVF
jgi:hypothetical protein